jgi:tRNA/rRNA methyltransferase
MVVEITGRLIHISTTMALDNVAFVLFKPKSPGNVGAAARALKNMGLRDLRIVTATGLGLLNNGGKKLPREVDGTRAAAMAVHGQDVLASATIHPDLASAVADRTLVVGTTARAGLLRSEARPIRQISKALAAASTANRIAVVFGPEDFGLTNQELKLCQRLVTIPTAPEYRSLNLAQAVMVVAYELMLAADGGCKAGVAQPWAPVAQVDAMLTRMARALVAIGFLGEDHPDHIMFALRAVLGRAGLKPRELDIMNGIASQILWFAEGGHETIAAKRRSGEKLR